VPLVSYELIIVPTVVQQKNEVWRRRLQAYIQIFNLEAPLVYSGNIGKS